jgi:hypothetical protein
MEKQSVSLLFLVLLDIYAEVINVNVIMPSVVTYRTPCIFLKHYIFFQVKAAWVMTYSVVIGQNPEELNLDHHHCEGLETGITYSCCTAF